MGVLQFPTSIAGTVGIFPAYKFMVATDNLATVTTPGYLNPANIDAGNPMVATDIVAALYNFNQQSKTGTFGIFTVSISIPGVITLALWQQNPGVILPVEVNHIAAFYDTNGDIYDPTGGIQITHDGSIASGRMGSSTGSFVARNATPNSGALTISPSANLGNFVINVVNLPMGQSCTIGIPDPGVVSARFLLDHATNTLAAGCSIVANKVSGTESGGNVTASGMAGFITTSALTTIPNAEYVITWTNTFVTSTSSVLLTIKSATSTNLNINYTASASAGSVRLGITNLGGVNLNGNFVFNYLVI